MAKKIKIEDQKKGNHHSRRADIAWERGASQRSIMQKARIQHELEKRQRAMNIQNRIIKARAKKAMKDKMSKVGQGIAQPHMERRAPKATVEKK